MSHKQMMKSVLKQMSISSNTFTPSSAAKSAAQLKNQLAGAQHEPDGEPIDKSQQTTDFAQPYFMPHSKNMGDPSQANLYK